MKYSLYFCIARLILYDDYRYMKWLRKHSYYLTYYLLICALIATCLTLIGQFMANDLFTKRAFVFAVAPVLWWAVYKVIKSYDKRLRGV